MKVDIKKAYRAKNGVEVRLFADNGVADCEIIGAIKTEHGWEPRTWSWSGRHCTFFDNPYDLIEVKINLSRNVWINVYNGDDGLYTSSSCATRRDADSVALTSRFACIPITINCKEGEGL